MKGKLKSNNSLKKYSSGIHGLGEITFGGLHDTLEGKYQIDVTDFLENPQLGLEHQILAIPTLVRRLPVPVSKIIRDLSNTERVLVGLDLQPDK